jgi:hypothetical protein
VSTPNGRRVYRVNTSADFDAKVAKRSSYQSSLERVLEGIKWSLGCDPRHNARNITGDLWVVESPEDLEIPVLYVYYTIKGDRVILQTYQVVES